MSQQNVRLLHGAPPVANFGFFAIVLAALVFLTVCCCFLQAYCKRYFGINFCPASGTVMSRSAQLERIRMRLEEERAGVQQQHQLEEQEQANVLEAKRTERRTKYKALLVDNTMVRWKFCIVRDYESCPAAYTVCSSPHCSHQIVTEKDISTGVGPIPLSDSYDIETGNTAETNHHNHHVDNLVLTLPIEDEDGKLRCVSGHCAVCIAEYTAGDSVVWSTSEKCPHVFHDECILMWLSKGKKRCPICRNIFAPTKNASDHIKEDLPESERSEDIQERDSGIRGDSVPDRVGVLENTGQPNRTELGDLESQSDAEA